jgi:Fe2+ transport system protein FeoA
MYLPYFKRKVVFCSQKVKKLVNSMGFVVGSQICLVQILAERGQTLAAVNSNSNFRKLSI